ncbi:jg16223 [Pararge aegeria aegeria]|uniref:Jg16223 protein n=1 Tax=Pararge aegeria aegeria TaxID=348720 RepID=A0A8S4RTQ5_9NEOP|nr:jg16223 [Pararge aegeria aegeria]
MLPVLSLIAVVIAINIHNTAASVIKPPDMPIQYPEPLRVTVDDDDVPASCRDLTYCTVKPKNYPEEKFNKMFKDYKAAPQPVMLPELTNKYGEEENCNSIITNEPLYQVREKRHKLWRTVVQAPGHAYIQRVLLEKCSDEGAPCFESICMAGEYKPVCKQKYYTWELLVSKGDSNETEKIIAELPGSCSCNAQKVELKF